MKITKIGKAEHSRKSETAQDVRNKRTAEHHGNTDRRNKNNSQVSAVVKTRNAQRHSDRDHGETEQHAQKKYCFFGSLAVGKEQY